MKSLEPKFGPKIKEGFIVTSSNFSDYGNFSIKSQAALSAKVLLFEYGTQSAGSDQWDSSNNAFTPCSL